MKRFLKILLFLLLLLIIALIGLYYALNRPSFQNFLAQKAVTYLSEKLNTTVCIDKIEIDFFNTLDLQGFYIEDLNKDTLLYAGHLKADVNLFSLNDQQILIEDIALENTFFHFKQQLNKKSNLQFIIDAFASKSEKKSASAPWKIDLNSISLEKVKFIYSLESSPYDMHISSDKGKIEIDSMNLSKKYFAIDEINMDGFDFKYLMLPKSEELLAYKKNIKIDENQIKEIKRQIPIDFFVKKLNLNKSSVDINNTSKPRAEHAYFDHNYIHVSDLNMEATDVHNKLDSVFVNIEKGNFVLTNDYKVKTFESQFKFSFDELNFQKLKIETSRSKLQNEFQLKYKDFSDFDDFENLVTMNGNLENSKLYWDDIIYFAPIINQTKYIKDWKGKTFELEGKFSEPLSKLKTENTQIAIGRNTKIKGDFSFTGLPDINTTFMEIDAKELTTNSSDIQDLVPSVKMPPAINELGEVNFKGTFKGYIRNFDAAGVLLTDKGKLTTDIHMEFNQNYSHAQYKGKVKAENLNLGSLTQKPEMLGNATFDLEVDGEGLNIDALNSSIKGNVEYAEIKGKKYQSISLDGKLNDKIFEGELNSNDPTIGLNFTGKVDFNSSDPVYDFKANIIKADLQELNITKKPCIISTKIDLDMQGKHIDSIIGNAILKDIEFTYDSKSYELDVLKINSFKRKNEREVQLKSNLFDANFKGDFLPSDLPAAINGIVVKYFPSQSFTNKASVYDNKIAYKINVYDSDKLTELFIKDFKGLKNAEIIGTLDSERNTFEAKGNLPGFFYKDIYFDSLMLATRGESDNIIFSSHIKKLKVNKDLEVPNILFSSFIYTDSTMFNLIAGMDTDSTRFDINGIAIPSKENINLKILASDIFINHIPWKTSTDNQIIIKGKEINIVKLNLFNDKQSIAIQSKGTQSEDLHVELENIKIQDLMSLTGGNKYELKGDIFGTADLKNVYKDLNIETQSEIPLLIVGKDTIGNILANVAQSEKGIFNIKSTLKGKNKLVVNGTYNTNDKKSPLNLVAEVEKFNLGDLQKFVEGIFSDMKGVIFSDKIFITGKPTDIDINGNAGVSFGEFTVNYLKTHYTFNRVDVKINKNNFLLKNAILKDKDNNEAYVDAKVSHRNFKDIYFDINANTPNFLFLNTKKNDNSMFYGTAYCDGIARIYGPINALVFDIRAKSNKNTEISLPISSETDIKKEDFVVFLNPNRDTTKAVYKKSLNGIKLNFALEATPDAKIRIILDEAAGDVIEAQGNGNIDLNINTLGDFFINGEYVIENGNYLFTFRNIVNKKFEIDKGSTINWEGDAYQAFIDIRAIYKANAFVGELVKATSNDESQSSARADVDLILNLTGSLFKPNVEFDYSFPKTIGSGVDDIAFQSVNDAIKRDKNELNKQVMGLLAANTFLPIDANTSGGGTNNLSATGITTITEFFSTQLSKYLNDFLSEYIKGFDIDLGYRNYTDNNTDKGNQLVISMRKKFFQESIEVVVGGNIDINNSADSVQNNFAGDFAIIYSFKKNPLKIKAFRKTDSDIFNDRNITKNGVGLFYKQEFENFKDLFSSTEKERKKIRKQKNKKSSDQTAYLKKTYPAFVKALPNLAMDSLKFRLLNPLSAKPLFLHPENIDG